MRDKNKIVGFVVEGRPRKTGVYEGIRKRNKDVGIKPDKEIVVGKWVNWDKSLWVDFLKKGEVVFVVDSNVIEELYAEIQKLKHHHIKKGT